MTTIAARPAFSFDGRDFYDDDVVCAARRWGEWEALERAASREAAALGDAELRDALIAFRRARGLISADEYRRWIDERGLTTDEVTGYLRRQRGIPGATPGPRTLRAEAILSGCLRAWAERLARCAAAQRALGEVAPADLDRAYEVFVDEVVTDEAIERCLAQHRLDWQRLVWDEALFAHEGAAREAALWVRDDGMALEEVAQAAHVECAACCGYGYEPLLTAAAGDLVGPLEREGGWSLLQLRERVQPARGDPELVERARSEIVADALERQMVGRVVWHGNL